MDNFQIVLAEASAAREFWRKQFEEEIPLLEIAADKHRADVASYNKERFVGKFDGKTLAGLTNISQALGGNLFVSLYSCVNILLLRYTGQLDLVIGSPVVVQKDDSPQSGIFFNMLPLRLRLDGEQSFEQLFQNAKQVVASALANQLYNYHDLIAELGLPGDIGRNPLFNVVVSLQDQSSEAAENSDIEKQPDADYIIESAIVDADISFIFSESKEGLELVLEYNTDIYEAEQMHHMLQHLLAIMDAVAADPQQSIARIDFLTKEEKHKLLVLLNDTAADFPEDKTIVDLFEQQVEKTPEGRAVIYKDVELSYRELNFLSNQFADFLRKNYRIGPDELVGIQLERSQWLIVVIFGIMKAGGAYVPIAADLPQERIDYLVKDSACKVLIDEQELEKFKRSCDKYNRENQPAGLLPHHLAYCIYTSGSTGNPKGCLLQHNGLVNRLAWMQKAYPLTGHDVILQKTTFSFDVSVWELLWWAIQGASVCLLPPGGEKSPQVIVDTIDQYQVTVMHFVPSMLSVFLEYLQHDQTALDQLKTLKQVFTSGEALTLNQAARFNELFPRAGLMNLYGPTEASIDVTYFDCKTANLGTTIPIGKPIDNMQVYIVDNYRNLLPLGAVGEICLGGAGLARGYLNRPELTAEKFIVNPFSDAGRIYRTGDLGKWRSDGNIEYLGRFDDQVKIRGYRIELGEIENVLRKHDQVKDALVVAKTVNLDEKELVAYFTGNAKSSELKNYLKSHLPLYMVPAYYVPLEVIPLTSNGKVDRKALPPPAGSTGDQAAYIPPSNDMERALVKLWAGVLGAPEELISVHTPFFDLGGDSIKAIRLLGLIHKELGIKLPLKDLFSEVTIEKQASALRGENQTAYRNIETIPELPSYKLSAGQRRLWILNHFDGAQNAYNITCTILLEGQLDRSALKKAFASMAERHEILRTLIVEDIDEGPRQQILNAADGLFKLKETNLSNKEGKQAILDQLLAQEGFGSFDFVRGPLWRCHLVQLEQEKHVLIVVHHHIISDGWSMDVFRKDWCALYNAYRAGNSPQLAPLRIQYKDYASWHNKQLESVDILPHKKYWLWQFEGELPVLELPAAKQRPGIKTFNGANIKAKIDRKALDQLNQIGKTLGGTLFMNLLACVNTLIFRYTGQEDITVGSPMAGREHPDLENQIGFYVNTLALRTRFDGSGTFGELFKQIKEVTLNAYEHQLYPYDELVDALKLPRNINRNPLFDILVVLQNSMEKDAAFALNGLNASPYGREDYGIAKFDISFIFSESKEGLELVLEYNTDIYEAEQMHHMLQHLLAIMDAVAADPQQSIARIDFLTKEEKHKLLALLNDTAADFPEDKTIVDLFEQQVEKTPEGRAVIYKDVELSYRELNFLSNQFADFLRKNYRIGPDELVGIQLERSQWLIVVIFGIMKAGGAYVPIAADLPQERIDYLVKDSACKVLIDEQELEKFKRSRDKYNRENQPAGLLPHHLAYCIYTSGSTGNPKGCLLQHNGLVNRLAWMQKAYPLTGHDVILQKTTFSFDVSVWELLWWAIQGASVCLLPPGGEKSPQVIVDTIDQYQVTVMHFVPSMLSVFLEYLQNDQTALDQLKTLKQVFTSGEALTLNQAARFNELFPRAGLMNLYGPTEASIDVTYFDCKTANLGTTIPIGKPIDNTQVYIVDNYRNLLPLGAVGEICLGGAGLARGYLNRPELTAEKFIVNPFSDAGRIYRTGDLGKWRSDGNIEYLGRFDDQVKIRGYRIELGEIENVLRQCPEVSQAVVVARAGKDGEKRLIGYVVPKGNYDRGAVLVFLKSRLPDYMVPNLWMEIEHIPLNANGKADKKLLPALNIEAQIKVQYVAPRSESESVLVKIWEDVLKVNNIGISHDFFDLGGHSLLAVQIVNQIKKQTGKILPISELFKYSNIESLNRFLNKNHADKISKSLVPISPSGSKAPIYFIHGVGLNVMNFADLAMQLDKEQPVFAFQALGLHGLSLPSASMSEIAQKYVTELIEANPTGPYALAGYSLGGFIGLEMKKQLEQSGREVRMLAMIDTNANHTDNFIALLPKKLRRHINKWIKFSICLLASPKKAIQKQRNIKLEEQQYRFDAIKLAKESGDEEYYHLLKRIRAIYNKAYEKSRIAPFNDWVYLFRANVCVHYTNDKAFLGWRKYALKGVKVYEIPGDHRTMLLKPNVEHFARTLQNALDECFDNQKK